MIELNEITLCAVDSAGRLLAGRAMDICLAQCKFADSILFTHEAVQGSFRNVLVPPIESLAGYTAFVLKEMHKWIDSPFVLVTQWDGYVANPSVWSGDFLKYDYIGATWPWKAGLVGNGGFSLRSKRLLEITSQPWFDMLPNIWEDELICQVYRQVLERDFNIRFAEPEVAERFSYERGVPSAPTFGFHGIFNFWREVPDDELIRMIPLMPTAVFHSIHCAQLALAYYLSRRWTPLRAFYRAWRAQCSFDEVRGFFVQGLEQRIVPECLEACESLLRI
jgi:hypothetical protein